MSFDKMVDSVRIAKANADHDARMQAEAAAQAAVAEAEKDAEAAVSAAQRAADKGADMDTMMLSETTVETANRRLSVARRMANGAAKRRRDGETTRDHEIRQAHGAAMNAAMTRFIKIRSEALDVFAKLEALKAEHAHVRGEIVTLAHTAKSGVPNIIDVGRELISSHTGLMMDEAEFNNRLNQPHHHEWDVVASTFRWVE